MMTLVVFHIHGIGFGGCHGKQIQKMLLQDGAVLDFMSRAQGLAELHGYCSLYVGHQLRKTASTVGSGLRIQQHAYPPSA